MPTPQKPVPIAEAERAAEALFSWIAKEGLLEEVAWKVVVETAGDPGMALTDRNVWMLKIALSGVTPPGTQRAAIVRAFRRAYFASGSGHAHEHGGKDDTRQRRVLTEIRRARTHLENAKQLLTDRARAKDEDARRDERELGRKVGTEPYWAVVRLAEQAHAGAVKLGDAVRDPVGVDAPHNLAEWNAFVAETAVELRDVGMTPAEVQQLLGRGAEALRQVLVRAGKKHGAKAARR
jgi:hypothetical protein